MSFKKYSLFSLGAFLVFSLLFQFSELRAQAVLDLKLPFSEGEKYIITQAYDTAYHKGNHLYAVDFTQSGCEAYGKQARAAFGGYVTKTEIKNEDDSLYVRVTDTDKSIHSYYGHLSKVLVSDGDEVKQGQVLGEIGNTGLYTKTGQEYACPTHKGTHLHFAMYEENRTPLKPEPISGCTDLVTGRTVPDGACKAEQRSVEIPPVSEKPQEQIAQDEPPIVETPQPPISKAETPAEVAQSFYNAAVNNDTAVIRQLSYSDFYTWMLEEIGSIENFVKLTQSLQNFKVTGEEIKSETFSLVSVGYTDGGKPRNEKWYLTKVGSEWKLTYDPKTQVERMTIKVSPITITNCIFSPTQIELKVENFELVQYTDSSLFVAKIPLKNLDSKAHKIEMPGFYKDIATLPIEANSDRQLELSMSSDYAESTTISCDGKPGLSVKWPWPPTQQLGQQLEQRKNLIESILQYSN